MIFVLNQSHQLQNSFLGIQTSNFTATNQLFTENPTINYWRFEVVYTFVSENSSSALNFVINQSPENGSCSINPLNGTSMTLFTISCSNWSDADGIKDYSLYSIQISKFNLKIIELNFVLGYKTDRSNAMIIAFSFISEFEVRLTNGNENTSFVNLFIHIRDRLDCLTEFNLTSVQVESDVSTISQLIYFFENSPTSLSTNSLIQLLSSENQNTIGQILTSISQQFNRININLMNNAVSSKSSSIVSFALSLSLIRWCSTIKYINIIIGN